MLWRTPALQAVGADIAEGDGLGPRSEGDFECLYFWASTFVD